MRTFDDYILKQATKPLIVAIVIALFLLLLERMLRLLDFVLDSKGTLDVLLKLLTFMVPHYLGVALPAALFLALTISFGRFQRDSELDAFYATGLGLPQQLRPAFRLSIILTVVAAITFGFIQPYTRYTYRALIHGLTHGPINNFLQEGLFIRFKDTTYMVESLDRDRRRFSRVFAYRTTVEGESSVVTARLASLDKVRGSPESRLRLYDGVRMDLGGIGSPVAMGHDPRNADLLPSVASFDQMSIPIDLEQREAFRPRGLDERELTLLELWSERKFPPGDMSPSLLIGEFHERIVRILTMLALPFLAIPLALGRKRSSRAPGIVLGLLILVAYNKLIDTGAHLAAYENVTPFLSIWGPLILLTLLGLYLFARAAYGVGKEGLPSVSSWFGSGIPLGNRGPGTRQAKGT